MDTFALCRLASLASVAAEEGIYKTSLNHQKQNPRWLPSRQMESCAFTTLPGIAMYTEYQMLKATPYSDSKRSGARKTKVITDKLSR
jgi:hypothetical protein